MAFSISSLLPQVQIHFRTAIQRELSTSEVEERASCLSQDVALPNTEHEVPEHEPLLGEASHFPAPSSSKLVALFSLFIGLSLVALLGFMSRLGSTGEHQEVTQHSSLAHSLKAELAADTERIASFSYVVIVLVAIEVSLLMIMYRTAWHQDRVQQVSNKELETESSSSEGIFYWMFKNLPKLLRPYLFGPAWSFCWQHIALSLFLLCATCSVELLYNKWEKVFWDAVEAKDRHMVAVALSCYFGIVFAHAFTALFSSYTRGKFALHWREFQTRRLLHLWFTKHAHYITQMKSETDAWDEVDNPEQRIQEDVGHCMSGTLDIGWDVVNHFIYAVVFAVVVFHRGPVNMFGICRLRGWLLYFFIVYAAVGTCLTQKVGQAIVFINAELEKQEANLRQSLTHISEHSESIAICASSAVEEINVLQYFRRIKLLTLTHLGKSVALSAITEPYSFMQWMLPAFALLPSYLAGEISLGDIFQLGAAVGHVIASLDWFISSYDAIADWRASSERVLQLEGSLQSAIEEWRHSSLVRKMGDSVDTSKLVASICVDEICLPSGTQLWGKIKLRFDKQQSILVSGGEGQGKSTLFKVLAGVWPYVGPGSILLPSDVLFVPQQPVLPRRCSLRAAWSYPEPPNTYSDEALLHALKEVRLESLLHATRKRQKDGDAEGEERNGDNLEEDEEQEQDRHVAIGMQEETEEEDEEMWEKSDSDESEDMAGEDPSGLSRECNWPSRLSPGMQQRLTFGHVILRKPTAVFLDEATCHVTKKSAMELYACLFRHLPPESLVVTISHDVATMEDIHDKHYTIRGNGSHKNLHLIKQKDLTVNAAEPGQYAVVYKDDAWDEVFLCAPIPGHLDYWLCCTTDEDGAAFTWVAVKLSIGKFALTHGMGKGRKVSWLNNDEVNWICVPPDCEELWCPNSDEMRVLLAQAASLRHQLVDIPIESCAEVLMAFPDPCLVGESDCPTGESPDSQEIKPGCFVLVQYNAEWKEVMLCTVMDDHGVQWHCRTTDDVGSAFIWTTAVLEKNKYHRVSGSSSGRTGPPHVPSETISWICEPPDCEDLWCPSDADIKAVTEESQQVLCRTDGI